tara:strand:- start:129 stop:1037 length:909 start_codon:yes stop_codon:yes gene_type:complete
MYKLGSKGSMIGQIQEFLQIPVDRHFGPKTQAAVISYQRRNYLVSDGIIGPKTLEHMGILDTDSKVSLYFTTEEGLKIARHHLPDGEYVKPDLGTSQVNDFIFLHHTAGWNDPFKCIDHWAKDKRGRIATEFVVGGPNMKNGDTMYDGSVVQAFPEGMQGWHLGATGSYYMNRHSVGIEVCNFGYLKKTHDGYKNYVSIKAEDNQVVDLGYEFRGFQYWHKYSDSQLKKLKKLIMHIANRDNIDVRKGLVEWIHAKGGHEAFDFNQDAYEGKVKGLLTHTNVRKDKFDMFPQQELIDMLTSL